MPVLSWSIGKRKRLTETHSDCAFKAEAKVDISFFDGAKNAIGVDAWINQPEPYFNLHDYTKPEKPTCIIAGSQGGRCIGN